MCAPAVLLAMLALGRTALGTTCVQTAGPGCPSGATRLCDTEKIEDVGLRTAAMAVEIPAALCSAEPELHSYAINLLRYSRDLDLTLFRDALLCSDQRLTEERRREASVQRSAEQQELLRRRAKTPSRSPTGT